MSEPVEIKSLRTEKNKVFDIGDGSKRIVAKLGPVHRKDKDGNWRSISMKMRNGKIEKGLYPIELYADKVGYFGKDPKGSPFEMELLDVAYKEPKIDSDDKRTIVTWEDVEPDCDQVAEFSINGVRFYRLVKSSKANSNVKYRSLRDDKAQGRLMHRGEDAKGRFTRLEVDGKETSNPGEKIIEVKWDGRVRKLDPKTRKRSWISGDAIDYPVEID